MGSKPIAVTAVVASALVAMSASAANRHSYTASARVVDVEPIVRHVVIERPRRECWQDVEYRSTRPARIAGTTLAGGVIGAAIGRQFGDGHGRDALTLIGALAGSAVANDHARRNRARRGDDVVAVPVERCSVTTDAITEEHVEGYWVTYRYRGSLHRIRMHDHPGDRIRLQVVARPVAHR